MTARAAATPPPHRQALLGLLALLLLPVAGEALAQTATTTIELDISPKYIPEGTGSTGSGTGAESTITVTARYVTTPPSVSGPGTVAPATATSVTINVAPAAFAAGTAFPVATDESDAAEFTVPSPNAVVVTIPAGDTSAEGTFTLTAFDVAPDSGSPQGGSTAAVTGTATSFTVTPSAGVALTIVDSDSSEPTDFFDLSLSVSSVAEGEGTGTTNITVTASIPETATNRVVDPSAREITVAIQGSAVANSGATATAGGTDFNDVTPAVTITIAANETSGTETFDLTVIDDGDIEGDEILVIAGAPAVTTNTFAIRSTTLTITDNDLAAEAISVSLDTESVAEDSGTTTLMVTAEAAASGMLATTATITFALVTTGDDVGTATMGAADADPPGDFTLSANSVDLVFAVNDASMTGSLVLTVHDDEGSEGNETLVFTATTTAINPATGVAFVIPNVTLTITDNDAPPISVSLNTESVAEDSTTTLTVTAEAPAGTLATTPTITFALLPTGTTGAGTAIMGAADADPPGDFTLAPTSVDLVFAATDTSMTGTLVLTVHPDERSEGDETLVFAATTAAIDPATSAAFVIPNVTLTISNGQLTAEEIEEMDDRIESMAPELARTSVSTVVNAVSNRIGNIATGFAQTEFANSLAETLASNERGLNDGTLSLAETLAGSELSLGGGQADPDAALGVWVSADYERMSSKLGLEDWDGSQISLHAGVDRHITKSALVGMAVFWSEGNAEFDSDSDLETDTRLLGVNPYFGWHSEGGTHTAWGTFGYSGGDLEQKQLDIKTDLSMAMLAVGGSRTFELHSGVDLSLKGDLSTATISADSVGSADSPKTTSKVHRARLVMEASSSSVDNLNRSLKRSASLGLRRDSGDGDTGYGAELEAAIRWTDPQRGLTLAGEVRLLPLHSSDLTEWGVSGLVRYQPAHGRGLNFQLQPSYRPARSPSGSLWETEISDLDPAGEPEAHLVMDTGYGIAALSGQGLVTPYSRASLSEGGDRNYRLGTRIGAGGGFQVDLAGSRRESGDGKPEYGIGVNLDLRW